MRGWCYTFPYITRLLKKENFLVFCYGHDMTLWNVTSNENIMFTNSHACVCPHHKINIFLLLCDLLYPLWFLHSIQQSNFWAFCVTLFSARQLYDLLFHLNRQRWKRSLLFPVADFNKRALDQRLSDGSGQGWSTSSRQTNGNKII